MAEQMGQPEQIQDPNEYFALARELAQLHELALEEDGITPIELSSSVVMLEEARKRDLVAIAQRGDAIRTSTDAQAIAADPELKRLVEHAGLAEARLLIADSRAISKLAQSFRTTVSKEDLVQIGSEIYLKGIRKFDLNMPVKVITYCLALVQRKMGNYIRATSETIKVPDGVMKERNAVIYWMVQGLANDEIAQKLGISVERVSELQSLPHSNSLEALHGRDRADDPLEHLVNPDQTNVEDEVEFLQRASITREAMNTFLDERIRNILMMRFGIGCVAMTLEEIGNELGITRERVRQLEKKGLERLGQVLNRHKEAWRLEEL